MSVGSVGGGTFTLMVSLICLIISVVLLLEIGAIMDKKKESKHYSIKSEN